MILPLIKRHEFQPFPYHIVDQSPWPIFVSFSLLNLTIGTVVYFQGYTFGSFLLNLGFNLTIFAMFLWFKDVVIEGTFLGAQTQKVQNGIILGIILFIISEAFAFLSVFWAFFHSSLIPSVDIGGSWPPQGITPLNPFGVPLLNTFLLLSSGAFVTYGHHALIKGNRKNSIEGITWTVLLAVIFTAFQYLEYSEATFTITDSIFGTVFFSSTGLHGLTIVAPTKFNINKYSVKIRKVHSTTLNKLKLPFLNWLSGFVDAEGNFNISLRNYKDDKYNSLILTFQIGLHRDDLEVLKFIQKNLGCGKISISKNRCNFFVNDQASLINIIVPVFNLVPLKSSKYFQFLVFEKAVNLIKNKSHISDNGKKEIIKFYHEIKNPAIFSPGGREWQPEINKYWVGGFVDGDATFSANCNRPRLRFENHIKELTLFTAITKYFQSGNINISEKRKNRINSNPTVTLEYNNIHFLKNVIVPLFTSFSGVYGAHLNLLNSKKVKDFNDWAILVNIYYYGYHTIPEGKSLAIEIISNWNNFRLSTYKKSSTLFINFNEKYQLLSNIPSPYIIKDGIRFYRNTLNLVPDKIQIAAYASNDHLNKKLIFSSISECSKILQIERYIIKKYLLNGEIYKNYSFKFHQLY